MWITVVLVLFYLLVPVLLIYLTKISETLKRIGAVVLAYAAGLLIGNTGIFPSPGESLQKMLEGKRTFLPKDEFLEFMSQPGFLETDIVYNQIAQLQQNILNYTILLALPYCYFHSTLKSGLDLHIKLYCHWYWQ
jgi:hypothetical protein